jgi:hypothetical protein
MKKLTDKTRARLLFEMRERGGYKVLPFIRTPKDICLSAFGLQRCLRF